MSTFTTTHPTLAELVDLTGRTAIVTGGAFGIGHGIAQRLHEAGASVVIADVDPGAPAFASELEMQRDGSALALHTDVSDQVAAQAMVRETVAQFGGLDILVNNAGIYPQKPFLEMDTATFKRVIEVNLTGVFFCTRAAADQMIAQGRGGRIVNITSIDALHPSMVGLAHYDASKHGVWGFTKNIALELAPHGIWVNAIAPGGITTRGVGDMPEELIEQFSATIPMKRFGDPDDIARATLFLASGLSSYMTGSQIVVDGGKLLT